ncbi:uncharacterized protein [Dysidea avara]|uniref:uncharacterized protein isoform X2 n=1 Tax=Dysidea avara TaxID=196820 RepID=UPI0033315671
MAKPTLDLTVNHLQQDIQVKEDIQLGAGAYGIVFEVKYAGIVYAGKKVHPILLRTSREELERVKANFLHECQIWSTLRHPHIVQFIGAHYPAGDQSGLPIIVMEKMSCSLRSLVNRYENIQSQVPLHLKLSILHGTSRGLWYLHDRHPPIVHRDLTPNNILLGSNLEGKISDLGGAKSLKDSESCRKMTKAPGTPHFMPPEALNDNPVYDTSLDIFSYGAVTLYVITQQWPEPKAKEEQFNPATGRPELLSETERRQEYLNKMTASTEGCTEIKRLVLSCLADNAAERPKAEDVFEIVRDLKALQCNETDHDGLSIDLLLPPKIAEVNEPASHTQLLQFPGETMTNSPSSHTDKPIKITWKEGAPAPVKLWSCTPAVYLNGLVYVAGYGGTSSTACKIYVFDPVKNLWQHAIKIQCCFFALVTIHDRLLTVGGVIKAAWYSTRMQTTNKLFILNKKASQWKEYSQMGRSRANATAIGHEDMLIITGGCNMHHNTYKALSSTELLDTITNQWFSCANLPQAHYYLQSVTVGDYIYLLGGVSPDGDSPAVYTASLETLSQHHIIWKSTEATPCCQSGATSINGSELLVIGGHNKVYRSSNMYKYDNTTHSWKVISQIPEARSSPCVTTTSDNVIVVIGGMEDNKTKQEGKATNTVWIGSLCD